MQSILAAGGIRETARLGRVARGRTPGESNNFVTRTIDLEELGLDGAKEQIVLRSPKVSFVPRTAMTNAHRWVHQHSQDFLTFPLPRFPPF